MISENNLKVWVTTHRSAIAPDVGAQLYGPLAYCFAVGAALTKQRVDAAPNLEFFDAPDAEYATNLTLGLALR